MRHELAAIQSKAIADRANSRLIKMINRIRDIAGEVNISVPEYTGWFVLLGEDKESESGYRFLGIFNSDVSPEDLEPEWSVALPIPKDSSLSEFLGW